MELGKNIYRYRVERGLSQGALAEALEVSRQSVSKWENDAAVPELDKLLRMSRLFDTTLDELVNGTGAKPKEPEPAPTASFFPGWNTRSTIGFCMLLFGMVFFLLSVFWGDHLAYGEEFGELLSLFIALISVVLLATYNLAVLATCAVIYFLYSILCVGILHTQRLFNQAFLFFSGLILLVWFIVLGLHLTGHRVAGTTEEEAALAGAPVPTAEAETAQEREA
jgi:transcriptional regulator with XRE-family HTH domain